LALAEPSPLVLALRGPIARADLPRLCAELRERLGAQVESLTGCERAGRPILCDVACVEADAVTVEALARLRLTARRLGCRLRLRGVSRELLELLALTGLDEVLLPLEAGRQAEEREERLGVEEERELGDPAL
jgi:ABC-type transporter Mla MlaB component